MESGTDTQHVGVGVDISVRIVHGHRDATYSDDADASLNVSICRRQRGRQRLQCAPALRALRCSRILAVSFLVSAPARDFASVPRPLQSRSTSLVITMTFRQSP